MRPEALARAHLAARNFGFAESTARQAVEKNPNQVPALAAQVEILHAVGKDKEAREAYQTLEPLARWADRDLPVFRRLEGVVARWKAEGTWTQPRPSRPMPSGTDETAIDRIDLKTLGPLVWSPFPADAFSRTDTAGAPWNLAAHKGKNVVVIFFLGGKCAHCMQQLQTFGKEYEALKKLNVETVAISTDDLEAAKALKNNKDGIKFPMPILADPKLELFKLYRAYDDFENQPLHGTFLIDAEGNVRFQRISADPFLDVEFIKARPAGQSNAEPDALTGSEALRCRCSTISIDYLWASRPLPRMMSRVIHERLSSGRPCLRVSCYKIEVTDRLQRPHRRRVLRRRWFRSRRVISTGSSRSRRNRPGACSSTRSIEACKEKARSRVFPACSSG